MSAFGACLFLSGRSNNEVEVKSWEELNSIAIDTNFLQLLHQNFINTLCCHFWMRDYIKVAELGENHKPLGHKRILEVLRIFFEGIACLNLARQTHEPKWRKTGEVALEKILKWENVSNWNFGHMVSTLTLYGSKPEVTLKW